MKRTDPHNADDPTSLEPKLRTVYVNELEDAARTELYRALINLIDVVASRGAVRGEELAATGQLRGALLAQLQDLQDVTYG